jgi:hypothetical protein
MSYPVTPTLSVEAVQDNATLLFVVPVTVAPVGADGGVVSAPLLPPGSVPDTKVPFTYTVTVVVSA